MKSNQKPGQFENADRGVSSAYVAGGPKTLSVEKAAEDGHPTCPSSELKYELHRIKINTCVCILCLYKNEHKSVASGHRIKHNIYKHTISRDQTLPRGELLLLLGENIYSS